MSPSTFGLEPGTLLADKYRVVSRLGGGWEGEVYLVRERGTGIERSAKLFHPRRNPRNQVVRFHARKLHKLRRCPILIRYHAQEQVVIDGQDLTMLVSDYVDGEILSEFLKRQPGGRLDPFQAMHLLHALASGIAVIHDLGEYHGDLHEDNVLVTRLGLGFDVRLVDLFHWGKPSAANIQEDVLNLVRIFHAAVGGPKRYASQPPEVKGICRGLRRDLILERFRTAGHLKRHLEPLEWTSR
ncbi:protein kinase [bacterium]|nr:protein kinase [bacterium]